jgi:hypothetical protein
MPSEAILISKPEIDLENLFRVTAQTLGRRITGAIDNCPRELSKDEKFISALSEFKSQHLTSWAKDRIQRAEHELFFLHYVFLCYTDKDTAIKIREWTKLDVLSQSSIDGEIILVVGGSLVFWRAASLDCCSGQSSFNLRLLFDKIILKFEEIGLGDVWFNYRKRTLPDQTFLIEDKR